MALPVRSFGTVSRTSATVTAMRTAAPAPCTARAAISAHRFGAMAQSSEAAVNSASPAIRTRRWPSTSPSRPALTTRAVSASR